MGTPPHIRLLPDGRDHLRPNDGPHGKRPLKSEPVSPTRTRGTVIGIQEHSMESVVAYLGLAFIGLALQYLLIAAAVRHGVVSAQDVLDKRARKTNTAVSAPRHQGAF